MSYPLRKSTAGQVFQFTLIDNTDFKTPKSGLTIANTDIKLVFEGGTAQTNKNSGGATEIGTTGTYYCTFDATDTATLGRLHIDIQKAGALPYFKDTEVLPAAAWDALYAATGGALPCDAVKLGGTSQTGMDVGARAAHLDADISSRVATTSLPAGFLAATFPLFVLGDGTGPHELQCDSDGGLQGVDDLGNYIFANVALASALAAVSTQISNLNNLSALANIYGAQSLEIPDSGSTAFPFTVIVRDNEGKLVDLDGNPTIAASNAAGTSRSANLSAVTHTTTGQYRFTYTVASNAVEEGLRITGDGTVSGEGRHVEYIGSVVNADTLTAIAAIKAKTDNLPASPASTSDCITASGVRAALGMASANLDTQLTPLSGASFTSMMTMATRWLGMVEPDSGLYRYTVAALAEAPAGGGSSGDWTSAEKNQLRYRLGIDGATAVPATNGVHLDLTGTTITINSTVDTSNGDQLNLVQGDDHTEGDRLPSWTITGYTGPSMVGGTCVLRLLRVERYLRIGSRAEADLQVVANINQSGDTITINAPITSTQSQCLDASPTGAITHQYQLLGTTSAGMPHSIKLGPSVVTRSIKAKS